MPRHEPNPMQAGFAEMRAGYQAAKRSGPFKRRRGGIPAGGAGADYHYASEADYLWMTESARDLDRNDVYVGQLVDRGVDNVNPGGFGVDPDTGDKGLDAELKTRHDEESIDPRKTDVAGDLTLAEMARLVCRESFVAGDVFALPMEDGLVQVVENHLCRSATGKRVAMKNVFHGVELDPLTRRRLGYWFTREPIDPLRRKVLVSDLKRRAAYDDDGEPNVWHVMFPKRPTQTRCVTWLAPMVDLAGMHDDLQFSALLKAQLSAFFLTVRNRQKGFFEGKGDYQPSGRMEDPPLLDKRRDKLAPGSELRGYENEKVEAWSPNIPNAEFFPHMRMVLTLISINLGMPLVLGLLDASETNFSGYRGAVDQARLGFRRIQAGLKERFFRPYWRHKVLSWIETDAALRTRVEAATDAAKINPFRHKWHAPGWPYIEPAKDATADLIRSANMLSSPTRQCQERGVEWEQVAAETVRDRSQAIKLALKEAAKINKKFALTGGAAVNWRDLAPLPAPERVAISMQVGEEPAGGDAAARNAGADAPPEKNAA